jgi:molecular chaperone GrpE
MFILEKIELEAQVADLKDKYLRLHAEFDNSKKRNVKERLDLIKTASRDTLSSLLPVLDDFDRAKQNATQGTETGFSEGIQLVYNKLFNTLEQRGLKPMESTGLPFDPELHSAITEIPAPSEDMKGKVIDTIERGYYLNDVLIRHAKVVVGN